MEIQREYYNTLNKYIKRCLKMNALLVRYQTFNNFSEHSEDINCLKTFDLKYIIADRLLNELHY